MSNELKSISDRLNYILSVKKINQKALAQQIDVSPQVINYLCTSGARSSRFTHEIAAALEINPEWLATGKGPIYPAKSSKEEYIENKKLIPVFEWQSLSFLTQSNFKADTGETFILLSDKFDRCFGLIIADNSMFPAFKTGSLAIICPIKEDQVRTNDYVLIRLISQNEFLIRRLEIKNNNKILAPINKSLFKEIPFDSECEIIGVVAESTTVHRYGQLLLSERNDDESH